jgi:Leucine-rich repeat (LRR) protein
MKLQECIQNGPKAYYDLSLSITKDDEPHLATALANILSCQRLTLHHPTLHELPPSWLLMQGLKYLRLETPLLSRLPEGVQPEELLELTINSTKLSSFPASLLNLPCLERLRLDGLPVTKLPFFEVPEARLHSLDLQLPHLTSLPEALFTRPLQYVSLHLPALTRVPDTLRSSPSLWNLLIEAPLTQWPSGWQNAKSLTSVQLQGTRLSDLSDPGYFPAGIESLSLVENKKLLAWPTYSTYRKLKYVSFYRQPAMQWPMDLKDCSALEQIAVQQMPLGTFPEEVLQMQNLRRLTLHHTELKEIPTGLKAWKKLEFLDLSHNQLTDFPTIGQVIDTACVYLSGNPWKNFYWLIQEKLPTIKDIIDMRLKFTQEELLKFSKAIAKTDLPEEDRRWFFDQVAYQPNFASRVSRWDVKRLYQGLTIAYKPLRDLLLTRLHDLTERADAQALKPGSVLHVTGKTNLSRSDIRSKLQEAGVSYAARFTKEVSHVLVGPHPTEYEALLSASYTFLTENQLQAFLNEQQPQFLVEEERSGESQMQNSITALLGSEDPSNALIALEMLKTGGVPATMHVPLLLVQKTFPESKVRTEAKKLLQNHGPAKWMNLLADKQSFTNMPVQKERDIRDKLENIAKSCGADDATFLSMLLFEHYRKGLQYMLAKFGPGDPRRVQALQLLVKDGHLDFHAGIGYHDWRGTNAEDMILSYVKTGIKFPTDLPDKENIMSIDFHNCKFDSLSKDIADFPRLRKMDLSANFLKALPQALLKCQDLEWLDLSHNRFTDFPAVLNGLPNLRYLNLQNAKAEGEWTAATIPEDFRSALPQCEIRT